MKTRIDPVVEKIRAELQPIAESFGYELVQLKLSGRPGGLRTLAVVLDKPGGITSGDCQYMASRLSVMLDAMDPIQSHYTLVVTSPGLNRPLTRDTDFQRFAGENVVLRWSVAGQKTRTLRGLLQSADDTHAVVDVDGELTRVPLDEVEAANILYDWERNDEASD
jgi:ribosome maturation factor RimP